MAVVAIDLLERQKAVSRTLVRTKMARGSWRIILIGIALHIVAGGHLLLLLLELDVLRVFINRLGGMSDLPCQLQGLVLRVL